MNRLSPQMNEFSRQLRRDMTDAEQRLWQRIRMQQLGVKFRRQHPVGTYILDFACISAKLAIELDGGQHYDLQTQDSARTLWLESQGWRVLRFWNNEVIEHTESVVEAIYQALSIR